MYPAKGKIHTMGLLMKMLKIIDHAQEIKPLIKYNFILLAFLVAYSHIQISAAVPEPKNLDARQKLTELACAHILSRAIHVAARMNLADYLMHGPCSIDDLAFQAHADIDALYRLLRLLASNGIFHEDESGMFSLTDLAQPLLSDYPQSLKSWLMYHDGDESRWRSYGHMDYSIQTGKPAFNYLYGQGYFDTIAQDAEKAAQFDEGMRNISQEENSHIVQSYDFSPYKTIIDLGGGKGGLLAEILKNNSFAYGILYDLPHVMASAHDYVSSQNLETRVNCVPGSFFEKIDRVCDLYVLKRILHDWNDEDCIKILLNCRESMPKNSKLLIIEAVVATGNTKDFAKDVDLAMLVLFGGKERTENEWKILLQSANLKLLHIHKTPSMLSILEVVSDNSVTQ